MRIYEPGHDDKVAIVKKLGIGRIVSCLCLSGLNSDEFARRRGNFEGRGSSGFTAIENDSG